MTNMMMILYRLIKDNNQQKIKITSRQYLLTKLTTPRKIIINIK